MNKSRNRLYDRYEEIRNRLSPSSSHPCSSSPLSAVLTSTVVANRLSRGLGWLGGAGAPTMASSDGMGAGLRWGGLAAAKGSTVHTTRGATR
jgi:hypothetical protein